MTEITFDFQGGEPRSDANMLVLSLDGKVQFVSCMSGNIMLWMAPEKILHPVEVDPLRSLLLERKEDLSTLVETSYWSTGCVRVRALETLVELRRDLYNLLVQLHPEERRPELETSFESIQRYAHWAKYNAAYEWCPGTVQHNHEI